jgi:6,7-dimethyl-8-ribityllumazine synthase
MLSLSVALSSAFLVPSGMQPASLALQPRAAVRMATGNDAIAFPELDGKDVRIGIIRARWHDEVCNNLIDGVKASLAECGVDPENIVETEVPGSYELPLAARFLAMSGTVDAILPIGVLIKGDTYHFEAIADSVSSGLMSVGLSTSTPVIFGVLTVNTEQQAKDRSEGANNHGLQWGKAAVEMALMRSQALGRKNRKYFMGFGADDDKSDAPVEVGDKKIGF